MLNNTLSPLILIQLGFYIQHHWRVPAHRELLHLFMIFVYIRCCHTTTVPFGRSSFWERNTAKIRKFAATCVLFFTHFFEQEREIFPCRLDSFIYLQASLFWLVSWLIAINCLPYYLCGKLQMILLWTFLVCGWTRQRFSSFCKWGVI